MPGSPGTLGTPGTPSTPDTTVQVVDYIIPGTPGTPGSPPVTYVYYYDTGVFNPRLLSPNQFGTLNDVGMRTVTLAAVPGVLSTPDRVVYKTVTILGSPAIPPTVGIPATGEQNFSDFNIGWNTGAISRVALGGDFILSFAVSASAVGVVVGLNDSNAGVSYQEIKFGLYFTHGRAIVIEGGVEKGYSFAFTSTDSFSVKRVGPVVTYFVNNAVFYTSTASSVGTMFADSSIYAGGDAILSASFTSIPSLSGGRAQLQSIAASGANQSYAKGVAVLAPLTSVAGAYGRASSYSNLLPLASAGSNRSYASGASSLQPLASTGSSGQLAPTFSAGTGSLAYIVSAGRVLSGAVISSKTSNRLEALKAFGADHNYAAGSAVLAPLTSFGAKGVDINGILRATLTDKFSLVASGSEQALAGVDATMPMPMLTAFSGAGVRARMPSPQVTIGGRFEVVARVMATMPSALAVISGTSGAVGFVDSTLTSAFAVSSYSGAVVTGSLTDKFTTLISGSADGQGAVYARMPLFVVDARGSTDSIARIMASMPMIVAVPSAILRALAPSFSVVAEGHVDVQAAHEAYAVNLLVGPDQPHQVTHYTNFPFKQIVRHGDKYYGVSDTGLFLLGGDTDIGAPIPWAIKTGKTDFGEVQKKTVVSAYIGGSITDGAIVSVITGERENLDYDYPVPASATDQNWRVKFGRGLKTRYFAMSLADTNGGAFSADTIDLEIDNHKRRL